MKELFEKVFKENGYDVEPKIVKSNKGADFQCDDCFKLAKEYHKAPAVIAGEIVEGLKAQDSFNDYFKEVSVAGPGFINIVVSDKYINDNLRDLMGKEILGATKEDKMIVVDYGGPNVAKPLHVGHLRAAVIGQAINNILIIGSPNVLISNLKKLSFLVLLNSLLPYFFLLSTTSSSVSPLYITPPY